jgi:hypothetical protein
VEARVLRGPKANVFEAGRVFGVGLESVNLALLKLREEPRIFGPEETNVRY